MPLVLFHASQNEFCGFVNLILASFHLNMILTVLRISVIIICYFSTGTLEGEKDLLEAYYLFISLH